LGAVLVTGGAGYVGSHVVRALRERGFGVVVLDDLSSGRRAAISDAAFVESRCGDPAVVERTVREHQVDVIVHMAASCEVAESVAHPGKYFRNNVAESIGLLDGAVRAGVRAIVFSSTAAVYGEPVTTPIDERHPTAPANPYGESKLAIERALPWYRGAHGLQASSLRYFNAAGAHPDGDLGEDPARLSRLLPNLLRAAREGGPPVPLHGVDWSTPDGTCIRDYVHVCDLADAHVRAVARLRAGATLPPAINLGSGRGFSVLEVVAEVRTVTAQTVEVVPGPRRPGDPARLVASNSLALEALGWTPRASALPEIVASAWRWDRSRRRRE